MEGIFCSSKIDFGSRAGSFKELLHHSLEYCVSSMKGMPGFSDPHIMANRALLWNQFDQRSSCYRVDRSRALSEILLGRLARRPVTIMHAYRVHCKAPTGVALGCWSCTLYSWTEHPMYQCSRVLNTFLYGSDGPLNALCMAKHSLWFHLN